ncbi:MAG TPA: ATP-binding protein [Chryseosolibacter sp.]
MIDGVRLLCFYGPESTGKTVMARRMAEVFQTGYVPEVAREMITSNDFSLDDIIRIGRAQNARVLEKVKTANRILFCDTDVITTQIYSQQYLHEVPAVLLELEKQVRYDQYFFFFPDVPWLPDGLRDLGHKREEMTLAFRTALEKRKIPFIEVKGSYEERERFLIDYVSATFRAFPTL